jgi:hypothetical protein
VRRRGARQPRGELRARSTTRWAHLHGPLLGDVVGEGLERKGGRLGVELALDELVADRRLVHRRAWLLDDRLGEGHGALGVGHQQVLQHSDPSDLVI